MKVLFVCSGNGKDFEVAPFILRQYNDLKKLNIEVDIFTVRQKGIFGYLKNINLFRKYHKENRCDIIHAHYAFNGLLALLSFIRKPIVVSYMGSDIWGDINKEGKRKAYSYLNLIISKVIQPFVTAIIVKSSNLGEYIFCKEKMNMVPNGVDMDCIYPLQRDAALQKLGLNEKKEYILFLGNKHNTAKNFTLTDQSFKALNLANVELIQPYPIKSEMVNYYYSIADVFVLSSFNEGSPNVIKEAMACNRPIVATNVGDIKWLFGDEPGHFIADFSVADFSEKMKSALQFAREKKSTEGRKRIINLGLDSHTVAEKIVKVYNQVNKD